MKLKMPTPNPSTTLSRSENLDKLHHSLQEEKRKTAVEVAKGSRYDHLKQEDKNAVTCMSNELTQYGHYLKSLQGAAHLNKFITLVQTFAQRKMRELFVELSNVIGGAYSNSLEDLLFKLRDLYQLHDQLLSYLSSQCHHTWAVGTSRNSKCKHRELFRYQFPECDFNRPLVIRNPDLWVDNAIKMFYSVADLFTKFKGTVSYAISGTQLLWLGRCVGKGEGVAHPTTSCGGVGVGTLWLRDCVSSDTKEKYLEHNEFNAVWFPQFYMYVQFSKPQKTRKGQLCVEWSETINCRDEQRQLALVQRCSVVGVVQYELYNRPVVDWELFCPFRLDVCYVLQTACSADRDTETPSIASVTQVYDVDVVREDYMLILRKSETSIKPGTYVQTELGTCDVSLETWQSPLEQLLQFYKCAVHTMDMQLSQTESQTKQLYNMLECIQDNIAMYETMVDDYVDVNTMQAMNKFRKLGEMIEDVENLLGRAPLQVVSTSLETGKVRTIECNRVSGNNNGNASHEDDQYVSR